MVVMTLWWPGSGKLKGYDPETGEERWTCNSLLRTIMTTPAVRDDMIYVSVQSYGDTDRVLKYALLQWKDTNQDGKLGKDEVDKEFWTKFDKGDGNSDGFLVEDEIDAAFQAPDEHGRWWEYHSGDSRRWPGRCDQDASRLESGQSLSLEHCLAAGCRRSVVLWSRREASPPASIPQTGERQWEKKRIRNLGNYYASPVAGDGKIYVMGENGFLVVLRQGPRLEVLAKK